MQNLITKSMTSLKQQFAMMKAVLKKDFATPCRLSFSIGAGVPHVRERGNLFQSCTHILVLNAQKRLCIHNNQLKQ